MIINISSFAVLTFAIFAIIFRYTDNIRAYSIFKPLTTILILIISILIYLQTKSIYSADTSLSLLFCLIGDILLLNKKYFLFGLSFFLFAHIGFITAFASINGFLGNMVPLVILVIFAGPYFCYLRKDLKKYTIPAAVYICVIIIMTWQAINLLVVHKTLVFGGIAFAAFLFLISDSILAFIKFKKSFGLAEILILTTYWTAIYIFAIAGKYI